jgi:hypothetical protein
MITVPVNIELFRGHTNPLTNVAPSLYATGMSVKVEVLVENPDLIQ